MHGPLAATGEEAERQRAVEKEAGDGWFKSPSVKQLSRIAANRASRLSRAGVIAWL
jgi:hypothetical protein